MGFIQWHHLLNYDVLCLQESYIISKKECCAWFSSAVYDSIISPGSNRSRGSLILYRNSFSLQNHWSDTEGRLVFVEFAIRELSFRVLCVYAPNRFIARNDFLQGCADVVDPGIPTFVLGDFNTVFDRSLDRRGSDLFNDVRESSLALRDFFSRCCVVDIWRDLHPLTPAFTWESPDRARASRIDLIGCPLCGPLLFLFVTLFRVLFPIARPSISRSVHLSHEGRAERKCHVSVLDDPDLRTKVESFWLQWRTRQPFFPSVGKWCDKGKTQIKALISQHCSTKALKTRQERDLLNRLASHLKAKLDAGMSSVAEPLESVLLSIADMNRTAAKGARVRAREKWAEEGESSSKYFYVQALLLCCLRRVTV